MAKGKFKKSTVAVAAVIITVFVAAAVAALVFFIKSRHEAPTADSQAVVYTTNEGTFLSAGGKKHKLVISDDSSVMLTSDNEYLIYTTPSAKISQKYDLYTFKLSESSSSKKGASLLDYGVEKTFDYNDGILYYSKQNDTNLSILTTAYDLKKGKKTDVDFAVKELYIPSSGDVIYYLKSLAGSQSLYSFSLSEGSREIAKSVLNVHFYDNGTGSELIYETGSYNEGESELFSITPGQNPVQIATMVSSVMYDDYEVGRNLYYLVKRESPTSWRDIINDDMAQSDELIKEPNKNDYTFIFGFSISYQLDSEKYRRKTSRDKIRQALDEQMTEENFGQGYNLYVRTSEGSTRLAENVASNDVFSVSKSGTPAAVFRCTEPIDSTIKMSDLDAQLDSSSAETVAQSAVEAVKASLKKSGYLFADTQTTETVKLNAYDDKMAEFILADGKLFVKVNDNDDTFSLYRHTAMANTVSAAEMLDSSVTACKLINGELWYQRSTSGSSLCELYRYSGAKEKIDSDISSFTETDDGNVIIAKNFVSDSDETADLYLFAADKLSPVAQKVSVNTLKLSENGAAFLRNGDELCIYSKNKLAIIDSGVYNIIAY